MAQKTWYYYYITINDGETTNLNVSNKPWIAFKPWGFSNNCTGRWDYLESAYEWMNLYQKKTRAPNLNFTYNIYGMGIPGASYSGTCGTTPTGQPCKHLEIPNAYVGATYSYFWFDINATTGMNLSNYTGFRFWSKTQ